MKHKKNVVVERDRQRGDDEGQEFIDPSLGPAELLEQQLTQERIVAAWERLGLSQRGGR